MRHFYFPSKPNSGGRWVPRVSREPCSFLRLLNPECPLTCSYLSTKPQGTTSQRLILLLTAMNTSKVMESVYTRTRPLAGCVEQRNAILLLSSARPRGRTGHCWRLWQCRVLSLALNGREDGAAARCAC